MAISSEQIKLLESYRDKSYITSILCSQSAEHFSFLRSIINIPLILSSSTMTKGNTIYYIKNLTKQILMIGMLNCMRITLVRERKN